MAEKRLLGIDVGTSLIKAVVFDLAGRELGLGARKVDVDSPQPGWNQQDPRAVWTAAAAAIREALQQAGVDPAEIAVVGPAGQGDGAWMVDAGGRPVGPAPLWSDGRAADIVERWLKQGRLSQVYAAGGTVLWSGAQAPLLAWYMENDPAALEQAHVVFCCKDWIKYQLTGTLTTDETDGSIPFMRMASRAYDRGQLELLGLERYWDKLPPVRAAHEVVGTVTAEAAAATGLRAGTPVVAGLLDVAANAIGVGVTRGGQTMTILGTTALNAIVMDEPILSPADVGATVCHGVPGTWLRALGTMAGTPNLEWYLDSLGEAFRAEARAAGTDVYQQLETAVAAAPLGAGGVLYHPYLQGERAPFLNPHARAGFYGLSAGTTRGHLARAVYEGVALAIRDCFEKVARPVEDVRLTGGGAKSPVWCQIMADVTGARMSVPAGSQAGTLGAALAGAVGVGLFPDYGAAVEQCVRIERVYEPDPQRHARYSQLYRLYDDLVAALRPFWEQRERVVRGWEAA